MSSHHLALICNIFSSIICSIVGIIFLGLTTYMVVTLLDNVEIFGTLVGAVIFAVIFMEAFISLQFTIFPFTLAIMFGINASDYDD